MGQGSNEENSTSPTVAEDNSLGDVDVKTTPPLLWRYANATIDFPVPYEPGTYVLKVVKNVINDHPVLGQSAVIWVHNGASCPLRSSPSSSRRISPPPFTRFLTVSR